MRLDRDTPKPSDRFASALVRLWIASLPIFFVGLAMMKFGVPGATLVLVAAGIAGIMLPLWLLGMLAGSSLASYRATKDRSMLLLFLFVGGGLAWALYSAIL